MSCHRICSATETICRGFMTAIFAAAAAAITTTVRCITGCPIIEGLRAVITSNGSIRRPNGRRFSVICGRSGGL